ncbi:hypothetical protein [Marinilactibacillus kalidii]|uniref:hypothetical protein n=1 Tax=Marinilactibacillus kalidii TaxID=2820274 RepID=UPI001ABDF6DA|nr:hypothetical protein [Marinilactibacillus kalidii]
MPQTEFDPKTLVWYPLFSFVFFFVLYIVFDLPYWIFFIVLFFVVLYYGFFIYLEIKRKD